LSDASMKPASSSAIRLIVSRSVSIIATLTVSLH
jgi:hypothetical protein